MVNESLNLKGGVLIIGSLLWQDHLKDEKDDIRKSWREKNLLLDKKIMVKVPIRYGRLSLSNIYTMTFSNSCKKSRQGTGFFVPFKKNPFTSFGELLNETRQTSLAEGMNQRFLSKSNGEVWCCMGLLTNPYTIEDKKKNYLIEKWSAEISKEDSINTSLFKLGREKPCISKSGELNIDWISPVDKRDSELLNQYDFAIATATVPTKYPSVNELAQKVNSDKTRYYFIGNYRSGITTFQDIKVLNFEGKKANLKME